MPLTVSMKRDRFVHLLLWVHVALMLLVAFVYKEEWYCTGPGIGLAALATLLYNSRFPKICFRYTAMFGYVFASAFFIHASHGLVEMHFHVFFVLALLAVYLEWKFVTVGGTLYALHQVVFYTVYVKTGNSLFYLFRPNDATNPLSLLLLHVISVGATVAILNFLCIRGKQMLEEIKAKERAENFERMKHQEHLVSVGQIAASIAHEIRNPLTSINGFVQLLTSKGDCENLQYYQIIQDEIKRIDTLIREVLLLSKSHTLEGQPQEINLKDVLERTVLLVEPEGLKNNITIHMRLEENVFVHGIDDKLSQVFLNLLRNAVEAIGSSGQIEISLTQRAGKAVIKIADDGPGIQDDHVLENLFMPFYTTKEHGTGLGLPVCKSIIEFHEGTIKVLRNQPTGLIFQLELPALGR